MNTETKQFEGHTPGPWIFNGLTIEALANGEYLAPVCTCDPEWTDGGSQANAALIATAPELLKERDGLKEHEENLLIQLGQTQRLNAELLKALKKIAESSEPNKADARGFQAIAKAAIAKAEGRGHAN